MALLAYNKTTAPLALAAGNPIRTLPAAPATGSRADGFDVTSEERNLSQADYVLLQAQVDAGLVEFEWSEQVEYGTWPLFVNLPGIPEENVTLHVSPASASPPGNDENDGSIGAPVLTYQRAVEIAATSFKSRSNKIVVHGSVDFCGVNTSNLNFGHQTGVGTPIAVEMDVTVAVNGTVAAGSTASNLISTTPLVTRFGSDISVIAGAPAGQTRLSGASLAALTAADAGLTSIRIRRAQNQLNNGNAFGVATIVGPTSIDIYNPQGVVGDAANGAIYWQEDFFTRTVVKQTGAANTVGCEKTIVDHGVVATTLLTFPALKATLTDNMRFTAPDTLGLGGKYEFKITGGFAPTAGFTTIDLSSGAIVTGADCAAATLTFLLGASGMGSAWNVKPSRASLNALRFTQLIEGSAGNQAVTLAGGATFTLPSYTSGVGDPLTTVVLNTPLTNNANPPVSTAPVPGDTFGIYVNVGYVNYGAVGNTPQVMEATGGVIGFKNCLFVGHGQKALIFRTAAAQVESMVVRANGGAFNCNNSSEIAAGQNGAQSIFQNAGVLNPFDLSLRLGKAMCVVDAATMLFAAFARMAGHYLFAGPVVTHQALSLTNFATFWSERTTWNCSNGPVQFAGPSRMREQRVVNAAIGILNVSSAGNLAAAANLEISNSGGHGLQISAGSKGNVLTTVSGNGNVGNGLNASQNSIANATGATITGNAIDLKVGNGAARFWASFTGTAPIGAEYDATGDGSYVRATTSTAFGLTQLVSGGAVPTVAAGTGAGAAPTSITVVGDNVSGTVTLVTNVADTPAANATIFTLTFAAPGFPAGTTPRLLWTAANGPTADLAYGVWRALQADTTVLLTLLKSGATPLPATTAATYVWNYHIIAK